MVLAYVRRPNFFSQACLGVGIAIVLVALTLAVLAFIVNQDYWFGSIGILLVVIGLLMTVAGIVIY